MGFPRLLIVLFVFSCTAGCATQPPENLMRGIYLNNAEQHDPKVIEAIRNSKIIVGMKPLEVRAAWGEPHEINSSGGVNGASAQWVYGYFDYYYNFVPSQYVYFEGDKVTDWQTLGGH